MEQCIGMIEANPEYVRSAEFDGLLAYEKKQGGKPK